MKLLLHFVPSILCMAALASAQTATTTLSPAPGATVGNSNNYYPLGVNGQRYMQVHDYQGFTNSNPLKISEIQLRMAQGSGTGTRGGHTVDVAVWLSHAKPGTTQISADTMSATFNNNYDPTSYVNVLKRKKILMPKLSNYGFGVKLPFDSGTTFFYGAILQKNLVVEIRVYGNSANTAQIYPLDAFNVLLEGGGQSAQNGSYGGCKSKSQSLVRNYTVDSYLKINSPTNYHYGYGYLGATPRPAVMTLGATPMNVKLGQTSCYLVNDVIGMFAGLTNTSTSSYYRVGLPIPNNQALIGVTYLTQMFYFEPGANGLGLTSSRGLKNKIGKGRTSKTGLASRLWKSSSTPDTETTGSLAKGFGLIMQFKQ